MLRKLRLGLLALSIAGAVGQTSAQPAQAGVLSLTYACGARVFGPGVYGEDCHPAAVYGVEYRAGSAEASRITLSDLPGGGLRFTDVASVLSVSAGGCTLVDAHSASCPLIDSDVRVWGGDRGDLVDARAWSGQAAIYGGTGDDTIRAGSGVDEVTGAGGSNTIVGTPNTIVSYEAASGPVRVDLAKGTATMPGEHDRLVAVRSVKGSDSAPNRIFGGLAPGGSLSGGSARSLLVARGPRTTLSASGEESAPTTFACARETEVLTTQPADELLGGCLVYGMRLSPRLRDPASPLLWAPATERPSPGAGSFVSKIVVRSSRGAVVVAADSASPPRRLRLNRRGRALLAHAGRLRVVVEEQRTYLAGGLPRPEPPEASSFTTVLSVRR